MERASRVVAGFVAVTCGAVLLTGCAPKAAQPPPAMSQAEHRGVVVASLVSLQTALEHLSKANRYKNLENTVAEVTTAADRARAELESVTPPADLATQHAELVGALEAFAVDVEDLATRVDDRKLCTGATVRAEVGDADGTAALRTAVSAIAQRPGDEVVALELPPAEQKAGSRLRNGTYLRPGDRDGSGELWIKNAGRRDVVLTLAKKKKKKKPVITVYIRKGKEFTIKGVPSGTYSIFVSSGSAWDPKAKSFGRDCAFQRLDLTARYSTGGIRYELTLTPAVGGNTSATEVDPNEIPS